ncbi:uncharacterized protein ARMOST_20483 [Armillaria ostoyae]|uniref:Heterokaryon incompatibility domain-containing protein n=1 Tax=Armillaria ostoyae TaxID=47428 RepID=A0A284S7G2_ARMOS|nr:uncharacterized protein ARMOST_20483 [Armillaria ostoyae]
MAGSPYVVPAVGASGIYMQIGWCHTRPQSRNRGGYHMRGWMKGIVSTCGHPSTDVNGPYRCRKTPTLIFDLIRIEMLNLGAEYAWLDVLCLRQEGGLREDLRVQEWKLDVPTIGWVYMHEKPVVCYFCGLGRPLRLKPGYFEDDRCWFRLLEISREAARRV